MEVMRVDDLFETYDAIGSHHAGRAVRYDWIAQLRGGPIAGVPDVDVAVPLARLVHDDLVGYGTHGGTELTDEGVRMCISALTATVARLGVQWPPLPFRDYAGFKSHWKKVGASGSGGWQARRDLLAALFDPLHDQLAAIQARTLQSTLASPVTRNPRTGWPRVDEEIAELRRHFQNAHTLQDYSGVGNDSVRVLEAVSAAAYEPAIHLRSGEKEPAVQETKNRLERVIEDGLPGSTNGRLRKLAKAAIEVAHEVKHSTTPDRKEAGVAADAAILVANIIRRVREP